MNSPVVQKAAMYLLIAIAIFGWGFMKGQEQAKASSMSQTTAIEKGAPSPKG
jgi:hypothetical protein